MHMIAPRTALGRLKSAALRLRSLRRDQSGIAMIEAAVAMPTLIFMAFAGLETGNLMITHTRVSSIALSVADNASRIASGSNLALPQVRETDVNDVFRGAQLQSGGLDIGANGRIILSSLEVNVTGGQWVHWQRCYGAKAYGSFYGRQGTGLIGNAYPGMGQAGQEVKASPGNPVMFVEIFYDYAPLLFGSWVGSKRIIYTAAFQTRDARDTSNIFNPTPVALVNGCGSYPAPEEDRNNGHGNDADGYDERGP